MTMPANQCPVAAVTVTYNPDLRVLEAQLRALPEECVCIIVDNASRPELLSSIDALAAGRANARVFRSERNLGLAAAVNRGVEAVAGLPESPRFALLLDQDSEPLAGSVGRLVDEFERLEREGNRLGCVGPTLLDPETGLTHGFHQRTRWRWKRVHPPVDSSAPIKCANLNGSGTLVPVELFRKFGGLDESMFIDHVDTEWSFRLTAAGYGLWGVPDAIFSHRMGQDSIRFWLFGWRIWPYRSPTRHEYLFRNAVRLMRKPYVPRVWKSWAMIKLAMTFAVHGIFDAARGPQLRAMASGFSEGCCAERKGNGNE